MSKDFYSLINIIRLNIILNTRSYFILVKLTLK